MTDLEYFKLSKPQRMLRGIGSFFARIPKGIVNGLKKLGTGIVNLFRAIGANIADLFTTFRDGDWKTRLSYLIMGFGSFARGQWGRGLLFFLFQTVFNVYMFMPNAEFSGCFYLMCSKHSTTTTPSRSCSTVC